MCEAPPRAEQRPLGSPLAPGVPVSRNRRTLSAVSTGTDTVVGTEELIRDDTDDKGVRAYPGVKILLGSASDPKNPLPENRHSIELAILCATERENGRMGTRRVKRWPREFRNDWK